MRRVIAIGDVHGCRKALRHLFERVAPEIGDRVVFIGDYGDRGPDSKGVIDDIITLRASGIDVVALMGDHESMLLHFLGWDGVEIWGPGVLQEGESFIPNGGGAFLESYGHKTDSPEGFSLPPEHEAFFKRLVLAHHEPKLGLVFVHAGFSPAVLGQATSVEEALEIEDPQNLLWERTGQMMPHRLGATIVYGHSALPNVRVIKGVSIGIDTGAVSGGTLSAIEFPSGNITSVRTPER